MFMLYWKNKEFVLVFLNFFEFVRKLDYVGSILKKDEFIRDGEGDFRRL